MPKRQLVFGMTSTSEEGNVMIRECTANDVTPLNLTFDDSDSSDSGFESHDSENEISSPEVSEKWMHPVAGNHSFADRKSSRDVENNFRIKPTRGDETKQQFTNEADVTSHTMKAAVDRMDMETDLIGDGSQTHRLPTVSGRHKDLKSVSPHTVSQLLEGKYDDVISGYQIIDCRYPYEYEGGHIEGAVNLHTEAMFTDLISRQQTGERTNRNILIFHCEFSSERAPKMLRHLRSMDRKLNIDCYPFLFYPEVYLLDGGYKAFYQQHQVQCEPRNYVPMVHEKYSKQLRHFRVKSKSWTAGEKQGMHSRRHRMELSPLKFTLV